MEQKTIAQVAREAANLIRRFGWIQDDAFRYDAGALRMCIGGALTLALTDPDLASLAWAAAEARATWGNSEPPWAPAVAAILYEQYPDFGWPMTIDGMRGSRLRRDFDVTAWNDAEGRTEDEVLAILDKLAAQE